MERVPYTIIADDAAVRPQSFAGRTLRQKAVAQLLCRHVHDFYQVRREQWDEQTMVCRPLDENDPSLGFRPPGMHEE